MLHVWPLVLCWLSTVKNVSNVTADKPLFILKTSNRSAWFLLSFNDQIPRTFNRSSYSRDFKPSNILVNRCWRVVLFVEWRPCRWTIFNFKVWSDWSFVKAHHHQYSFASASNCSVDHACLILYWLWYTRADNVLHDHSNRVMKIPKSFSSLIQWRVIHVICICRFFLPRCMTLHLSTLNFICQSCDQLKSLFRSSCNFIESSAWLILPKSLVSSANFKTWFTITLSRSLMNIKNSTGPSTDPWGTPLRTFCHEDWRPLTHTLCFLLVSQFSIHLIATNAMSP